MWHYLTHLCPNLPLSFVFLASLPEEVAGEKGSHLPGVDARSPFWSFVQGLEAEAGRGHECRGAVAPGRLTEQVAALASAAFSLSEHHPNTNVYFIIAWKELDFLAISNPVFLWPPSSYSELWSRVRIHFVLAVESGL